MVWIKMVEGVKRFEGYYASWCENGADGRG